MPAMCPECGGEMGFAEDLHKNDCSHPRARYYRGELTADEARAILNAGAWKPKERSHSG